MVETMNQAEAWSELKNRLRVGELVTGRVLAHWNFGVFVSLNSHFVGLIEIINFKESGQHMTPGEYPALNETIHAVVLGFRDRNHQVELSARPSDLAKAEART